MEIVQEKPCSGPATTLSEELKKREIGVTHDTCKVHFLGHGEIEPSSSVNLTRVLVYAAAAEQLRNSLRDLKDKVPLDLAESHYQMR